MFENLTTRQTWMLINDKNAVVHTFSNFNLLEILEIKKSKEKEKKEKLELFMRVKL
ncbi:hypothetical protein [Bacillus cereus]|uniref:Uncharacterized protein n=1 Tax=Bacillus cereus HuA3-9 TaxID=1053205 RepID=R8CIQ5_BACCE|nr:hypothetical protein [Bacillus cereus]EOO11385.1 hypothetical protein IGA_05648 [Bacillus cereus HuA3-9]